jgi:hypothetical protein
MRFDGRLGSSFFAAWFAGGVLLACASRDPRAGEDAAASVAGLTRAFGCVALDSRDFYDPVTRVHHGCWCGPGNAYWTPSTGEQVEGPTLDEADACCKTHDYCYGPPNEEDPDCDCTSLNLLGRSAYDSTCGTLPETGKSLVRCPDEQGGDTPAIRACRARCCACDAALAACLRTAVDRDGYDAKNNATDYAACPAVDTSTPEGAKLVTHWRRR